MKIVIAAEADSAEPRVAGTAETVKKLKALGADVAVARGAGLGSGILDADYEAAGATVGDDVTKDADVVLKVKRPTPERAERLQEGRAGHRHHGSVRQRGRLEADGGRRGIGLCHGTDAAHHAGAVDGRALKPGESGGLPGGDRRGGRVRPRLSDDDDGGRHGAGGESVHHGGGRCRAAGDRDGQTPRGHCDGDRRAAGDQGAGGEPGRQVPGGRGRGVQERADGGRLRQADVGGVSGQAGGADRRAHQEAGHRHHHRADPGACRRRG